MKLERREYICDICKQIFLRRRGLILHFRRHTQQFDNANSSNNLMSFLPKNWKYIVKTFEPHSQKNTFNAVVLASGLTTSDHIKEWMKQFMNINKCNYILKYLDSRESRFAKSKHVYACRYLSRKSTKLSCGSNIRFTIRRNWENSAYYSLIHIKYVHNHSPDCAAILRYRTPSEDVQRYFRSLFETGYSPTQAYNSYKQHLYVQYNDNYDRVIADRAVNPDQRWVYYFYQKLLKEKLGPSVAEQMIITMKTAVNEFNERHEQHYCHYAQVDDSNFAVVLLTPLMIRAARLPAINDIVYVDYESQVTRYGLHVFTLFVRCCVGGIPIGAVITSSVADSVVHKGLQYYCSLIEAPLRPRILMTVDSAPLLNALRALCPDACLLLNVFHILEAGWKWLWKLENAVDAKYRKALYNYLQRMVYCAQPQLLDIIFAEMLGDGDVERYANYVDYVRALYARRREWAVCVQESVAHEPCARHVVDDCVNIYKEKVFKKLKSHNPIQLFYYMVNDVNAYYERKLYDVAVNENYDYLRHRIAIDEHEASKYRIEYVAESVAMLTNVKKNVHYVVNEELNVCSCYLGEVGVACKHLMIVNDRLQARRDRSRYSVGDDERRQLRYVADGSTGAAAAATASVCQTMAENQVIVLSGEPDELTVCVHSSDEESSSAAEDEVAVDGDDVVVGHDDAGGLAYGDHASDAMNEEIVLILNNDVDDSNELNAFIVVNDDDDDDQEQPAEEESQQPQAVVTVVDEFRQLMEAFACHVKSNLPYHREGVETMNRRLRTLLQRRSDDEIRAAMMNFGGGEGGRQ